MPYPKRNRTYIGLVVVFVLLLVLHGIGLLSPLEGGLRYLMMPLLGDVHGVSVELGDNYQFFKNKEEFINSYRQCIGNTERQTTLTADLKRLQDENVELKKQLGYFEKNKNDFVTARVAGKEITSIEQTIVIDRGSNSLIKIGYPVVVGNGILVGKTVKVEPDFSVVRLINDNQSRVAATVLNADRSLGVVEGGFGISLQMNLIPRDEIVQIADYVITSGLETNMPKGLVLGSVASIENEAYKPFQKAILTPGTDLDKLILVSVIIPAK